MINLQQALAARPAAQRGMMNAPSAPAMGGRPRMPQRGGGGGTLLDAITAGVPVGGAGVPGRAMQPQPQQGGGIPPEIRRYLSSLSPQQLQGLIMQVLNDMKMVRGAGGMMR